MCAFLFSIVLCCELTINSYSHALTFTLYYNVPEVQKEAITIVAWDSEWLGRISVMHGKIHWVLQPQANWIYHSALINLESTCEYNHHEWLALAYIPCFALLHQTHKISQGIPPKTTCSFMLLCVALSPSLSVSYRCYFILYWATSRWPLCIVREGHCILIL